jgi:hypothetical protein
VGTERAPARLSAYPSTQEFRAITSVDFRRIAPISRAPADEARKNRLKGLPGDVAKAGLATATPGDDGRVIWCYRHGRAGSRPAYVAFAASARFNAHRFFVAAMIAFLPAAESFRFGLETTLGVAPADAALDAAHLFRCASAIAFLAAALIFRRLCFGSSGAAAVAAEAPV